MRSPKLVTLALSGGLAAWVWATVLPTQGQLAASGGGSLIILNDADADGLDDALEARLGIDQQSADTDLDGMTDLEELMIGEDPLTPGTPPSQITPQIYADLYSLNGEIVISVYALRLHTVRDVEFYWGGAQNAVHLRHVDLLGSLVDVKKIPTTWGGYDIQFARYRFPDSIFANTPSGTLAVTASLDNNFQPFSSIMLLRVDGRLGQFREDFLAFSATAGPSSTSNSAGLNTSFHERGGGNQGGGQSGGIVPVEPDNGEPPQGSSDEVCVQILAPIGNLGSGRIEYRVESAGCEVMVRAICMAGCANTVGDTIIGLDIASLVGG